MEDKMDSEGRYTGWRLLVSWLVIFGGCCAFWAGIFLLLRYLILLILR